MAIRGHSSIVANAEAIGQLASFGVQAAQGFQKLNQEKAAREAEIQQQKDLTAFELNLINDQLGDSSANIQPSTRNSAGFNSEIDAISQSSDRLEMARRQGANPARIKMQAIQRYKDVISRDPSLRKEAAASFKLVTGEEVGAAIEDIVDTRQASRTAALTDMRMRTQMKMKSDYNLDQGSLRDSVAEMNYIDNSKYQVDYLFSYVDIANQTGDSLSEDQITPYAAKAMPGLQMLAFETRQDILKGIDIGHGGSDEEKIQEALVELTDAKTRYLSAMTSRSGGYLATEEGKKFIQPGLDVFDNAIKNLEEGSTNIERMMKERDAMSEWMARAEVLTPNVRRMSIMGEVFQKALGDTAGAKILFEPGMADYRNWLMRTFNGQARTMHPQDLNLGENNEKGEKVLSDLVSAVSDDPEAREIVTDTFRSLTGVLDSDPESLDTEDLELIMSATQNPDFVKIADDWDKAGSRYNNATVNYMGHMLQDMGNTFNPAGSVGLRGAGISWVAPLTQNIQYKISDSGDFLFVTENDNFKKHAEGLNKRYGGPLSRIIRTRAHAVNKNTDYDSASQEAMQLMQMNGGFQFKLEGADEETKESNK